MKKLATIILMAIAALATTPSLADTYNVRDFGATGDGVHIDSEAINKAIRAAAGKGGGTVYVPAGRYACYSIRMASHVELHLEQGAAIIAEFPPTLPDTTRQSPIRTANTKTSATATGRTH